jgi:hypothetical protein
LVFIFGRERVLANLIGHLEPDRLLCFLFLVQSWKLTETFFWNLKFLGRVAFRRLNCCLPIRDNFDLKFRRSLDLLSFIRLSGHSNLPLDYWSCNLTSLSPELVYSLNYTGRIEEQMFGLLAKIMEVIYEDLEAC